MTAVICALLSAAGFYFSIWLGEQWWLAWLAPIPVLWLAFGETKSWWAFLASWAAFALGSMSLLRAHLPIQLLALSVLGPSLLFAVAVMGARQVYRNLGPLAGVLAFAAIWAGFDFLISFDNASGSTPTPAASQVAMPLMIQSASILGYPAITFLIGFAATGIAATLRTSSPVPAAAAAILFAANAAFAYWHMSAPPSGSLRVALIDSDDAIGAIRHEDKRATLKVVDAYTAEIGKLRDQHVSLIVLPENIARLGTSWRGDAEARLASAAEQTHATLVAGFNTEIDDAQRNVSLAFVPPAAQPVTYVKRRLIRGIETTAYKPGSGPKVLANGTGLEICKDMDFQRMIRADEVATTPSYLAVPAWDFGADGWAHGRIAILRSVENGVPMARAAREGLLTLNDRYGRIVAMKPTGAGFATLIGDLPLGRRGGETIYDRIGDIFSWLCVALGIGLVGFSLMQRKRAA